MPQQEGIPGFIGGGGSCNFERFIYDASVYHSTTLNVLQEVLNVSGRGKVQLQRVQRAPNDPHFFEITVDGVVVHNNIKFCAGAGHKGLLGIYDFGTDFRLRHRNGDNATVVDILLTYVVI